MNAIFKPDYLRQPPAWFSSRILVGPGEILTERFARNNRITHVINCAQDLFCPTWWKQRHPGKYAFLDAIDSPYHNILDWYVAFEGVLRTFLRDGPLEGVVYVHCHAGMNRSASLALAYVCKNYSLPVDMVVLAVRRQRPCILQNAVFMTQVKDFINGRVQSAQNQRINVVGNDSGNLGLITSDNRSGSEGLQDTTGLAPGGDGRTSQ